MEALEALEAMEHAMERNDSRGQSYMEMAIVDELIVSSAGKYWEFRVKRFLERERYVYSRPAMYSGSRDV